MRLWRKARSQAWDPDEVNFAGDLHSWAASSGAARTAVRYLCAMFLAGETAVTHNVLPLLRLVAAERRFEEELFLTSFLADEAKHVDLFCRFFEEIGGDLGGLPGFAAYQRILDEELEPALTRLERDTSPEAQVRAVVTFNLVVEGVLAQAGLYLLRRLLASTAMLPNLQRAVRLVHRDESRHIAYGMYLLRRLIIQHGNRAYGEFLKQMSVLKPMTEAFTAELMSALGTPNEFHIVAAELVHFSQRQFSSRVDTIIKSRSQTMLELEVAALP
jgi:ribonucleoside-diphosphate reductase beta chain